MLRVVGQAGDAGTRIENRLGEPAANPCLDLASLIKAGLEGLRHGLRAPRATKDPYHPGAARIPASLTAALDALSADGVLRAGLGEAFITWYGQIKRQEAQRFEQAEDRDDFARRESFSRL